MPNPPLTRDLDDPFAEQRHYTFAHHAVPGILGGRPLDCAWIMASLDGARLREMWFAVPPRSRDDRTGPVGLGLDLIRIDPLGWAAALFTLPKPWFIPGAYHVAALGPLQPRAGVVPGARIFTLERTTREKDGEAAILGTWEDGNHFNLGPVPEIGRDAFLVAALGRIIRPPLAFTCTVLHRLEI